MIRENRKTNILHMDLRRLIEKDKFIDVLHGKTVMVTGATGLLGTTVVKYLLYANKIKNLDIRVIAMARNMEKAMNKFSEFSEDQHFNFYYHDIREAFLIKEKADYIVHGASITASSDFVTSPVETIETALFGTKNVLDYAKKNRNTAVIYLSSLEVYGRIENNQSLINEEMFGLLDPKKVRSSYSESKRMCENLCISYKEEFGVPVKIARLTQTFGPGVEYKDNRVFAELARCIIEKKDITLHSTGETYRNYCYLADAAAGIITIIVKGECGEAYNIANMKTGISIKDMAFLLKENYPNAGINIYFQIPDDENVFGYNPVAYMPLDATKLMNLGWQPLTSINEMFEKLIRDMWEHRSEK